MVKRVKDSGANIAMCQWGFDDEANHLLLLNGLLAVRWVAGGDVELLAMATGGRIIPRFEEIKPEKLGRCGIIKELSFGTMQEKMLVIKDCAKSKVVTVLVRGSSRMIVAEAKRAIHDSLCVVRNLVKDNQVVYGGGSSEIACYLQIHKEADKISTVD
jgi:T-complex protein 1 subunit epsilon